jgi:hypothetical protein
MCAGSGQRALRSVCGRLLASNATEEAGNDGFFLPSGIRSLASTAQRDERRSERSGRPAGIISACVTVSHNVRAPREGKNSWQTLFEEPLDAADRRS